MYGTWWLLMGAGKQVDEQIYMTELQDPLRQGTTESPPLSSQDSVITI